MITQLENLPTDDNAFINCDCMEGMKKFPDNYFDLAVVDPPYGAGFTEGGGCQGWFSKYHQENRGGGTALEGGLTAINRAGWHGKQKYHLGKN